MENDIKLLHRMNQGDRLAIAEFYDQYSTMLFHIAHRILNDQKAAEDVLLKVCLQIWDEAGNYDPSFGNPADWAVTLTRTKAIDCLCANRRGSRFFPTTVVERLVHDRCRRINNKSFPSRES